MIYKRSVFLFAWIISGILISSDAYSAQVSNHMSSHHLSSARAVDIAQHNLAVSQNYADRNSIVQQSEPQKEKEEVISKRWTGIGIGVTSVFFCLLLWILFQPNLQTKTISTLVNENDEEQDNEINLPNDIQVEFDQEVSLSSPFPLKEDQKSSDQQTVIQQTHLVRDKQRDLNLTISEDVQDLTAKHTPIIDAENQELVQMTATSANDMDVVFELILDLKNSDRQLRRKAIWELARTGDSRSIEPLIDIIPVVNPLDKSLILSAMSQIAHRNFEPIYNVLFAFLKDADSEVRKDAIRDVAALYESTAKINRHLHTMLEDSEEEVRQTAQWALKRVNLDSLSQTEKFTLSKAISTKNQSKQN